MAILVINSSINRHGNTSQMASELLRRLPYDQVNLNDYNITQLGQIDNSHDQFFELLDRIDRYDTLVFATPVYWHDMTGSMKLLIERMSEDLHWDETHLREKSVVVLAQGFAPGKTVLKHIDNVFTNFTERIGMRYLGFVSGASDFPKIQKQLAK